MKNRGEYHDLYVQCDTLLLADVENFRELQRFGNVRDKCIETYGLDTAYFVSARGLVWQACLKKDRDRIRIINRY